MLDSTVVALALPSIRHDVGATAAGLQWVMNGYLLAITVFVVTAGRLGDMFGRKRLFLVGMVVFALGSVVSGAARKPGGADRRADPAGDRRGADVAAVAGDRLQCLPGLRTGAGAWGLGGGLGAGPGDRAAGGRAAGRNRLAGDLLDQPAGGLGRDLDHGGGCARVDRSRGRAARRLRRPAGAGRRSGSGRPGAGRRAGPGAARRRPWSL